MNRRIEDISISTDQILTQDQLKSTLVSLKYLFDDLKAVKTESIKDCIMKEVFQTLGSVEKTTDQLYDAVSKADRAIDKLEHTIMKLNERVTILIDSHREQLNDIIEDQKIDFHMVELQKNDENQEDALTEIPKEERDCYTKWIEQLQLTAENGESNAAIDDAEAISEDEILEDKIEDEIPKDEILEYAARSVDQRIERNDKSDTAKNADLKKDCDRSKKIRTVTTKRKSTGRSKRSSKKSNKDSKELK